MTNKQTAKEKIECLVIRFEEQFESYKNSDYNETLTRRDFIDPFFKALGWDIDNESGYAEAYREVIHEDKVKVSDSIKAPDYSFRLVGGKRLFFVEAKKPSISVKEDIQPAYQVRRYGWSAKLPISIITDFEEFSIYDCTKKPKPTDKPPVARIKYLSFRDYIKEFDFLWDTFSKEQVLKGSFDKFLQSDTHKKGTATVDKDFLESLDRWRTYLAVSISWNNKTLDEEEINYVVQQTIDRIIFLRIAEDRGVEPYGTLHHATKLGNLYQNLFELFQKADQKYNSGLFNFKKDKISQDVIIDNKVIKTIINELYYPECPYEFSVLSVEILGSAYEQFLGKVIRITPAHHAKIEEKPEVRKAGGVYYTPQYIVDYIVKSTVGKLIEGKTPKEISKIKILDPACGSGSFLIGAFQYLLDYHKDYYSENGKPSRGKKDNPLTPDGHLTTAEKKRILLNNIFGVDLDANAVEVTKLSLLLKCLEGETEASINQQLMLFNERVLPTLEENIKSGNSLIDTDYYDNVIDFGEEKKIKPFNWQNAFSEVFEQGGFDIVIGNPPYVMSDISTDQKVYLNDKYRYQQGKPDLYRFFIERAHLILKSGGYFSFIVPNSLLTIPACSKLRYYLLSKIGIIEIINLWGQVFSKVSINSIIITTQKGYKSDSISIYNDKETNPNSTSLEKALSLPVKIQVDQVLKTNEYQIRINHDPVLDSILSKIESCEKRLFDVSDYTLGMQVYHNSIHSKKDIADRKYHSAQKENESFFPESGGGNINRYSFSNVFKEFVSYGDWCYNKPDWRFCTEERILIREIPNKNGLTCCLTDTTHISNKAIIIVIGKEISNKYLLGILNSTLIGFYVFNSTEKGIQRLFPRISLKSVRNLPIKISDDKDITNIIERNVEMLISLKQEIIHKTLPDKIEQIKTHINHCERMINDAIFKLYGLSEQEIDYIHNNLK